jgi:hypothetical protein
MPDTDTFWASVTVPPAAWKIAKPPCHGALTVPLALVQLVAAPSHVPLPPTTLPALVVVLPFQNYRA